MLHISWSTEVKIGTDLKKKFVVILQALQVLVLNILLHNALQFEQTYKQVQV